MKSNDEKKLNGISLYFKYVEWVKEHPGSVRLDPETGRGVFTCDENTVPDYVKQYVENRNKVMDISQEEMEKLQKYSDD